MSGKSESSGDQHRDKTRPSGKSMSPKSRKLLGGVIGVFRDGSEFLVIRRSSMVRAPLAFCFPGGGIEPGETEVEALVREMQEELGVAVVVGPRLWQNSTPSGIRLGWYDVQIAEGEELRPDPYEVHSIHYVAGPALLHLPGLLTTNVEFLNAVAAGHIKLPPR